MAQLTLPLNQSEPDPGVAFEIVNSFPSFPNNPVGAVAIQGTSIGGVGVQGTSNDGYNASAGVQGVSGGNGPGVSGSSKSGAGVYGTSQGFDGVHGETHSNQHAGVSGINNSGGQAGQGGPGVYGSSSNLDGVQGWSQSSQNAGVSARNTASGTGVWALATGPSPNTGGVAGYFFSDGADGVQGWTQASQNAGVSARNVAPQSSNIPSGFALWASSNNTAIYGQGQPAGYFNGDVLVTGDVVLVNSNGDLAEDFDVADGVSAEPGTVLVIGSDGKLTGCTDAYDTRVAGVVAGACNVKPAIVLQRINSPNTRHPVALVGKAFCKVDAAYASIEPGDLLTTSATYGHAMKLIDRSRAAGAILGKALGPLKRGVGLIPVLLTAR